MSDEVKKAQMDEKLGPMLCLEGEALFYGDPDDVWPAEQTMAFERALRFATRLHAQQRRKGSEVPYVCHLLGTAAIVLEHGGSFIEAIAALLHDAIEDQPVVGGVATRDLIRQLFGPDVLRIVEGCSDCDGDPKPPWLERKTKYLARIAGEPPSVRLVSQADKLHNMRSILKDYREIGEDLWSRFKGGREGTLWYYRSLVSEFRKAGSSALVEELAREVSELESLIARTSPVGDPMTRDSEIVGEPSEYDGRVTRLVKLSDGTARTEVLTESGWVPGGCLTDLLGGPVADRREKTP